MSKIYHTSQAPIRTARRAALWTLVAVAIFVCVSEYFRSKAEPVAATAPADVNSLMQVAIPDETPEIVCDYTGFKVSFNPAWHVPNYVAWELLASEVDGDNSRGEHSFAADPDVYGCATLNDYRRSGYDRGHMAPAADMKWSAEAMRDCHLLTNIVPQDHSLNSGRWNSLENKCRSLAQRDSAIVVICGPVLSDQIVRTVGAGVAVPERFFKVVLAPYANPPRAVAWVMPNRAVRESLGSMAMTVDQLEEITGFDFFAALPDEIEEQVESTLHLRDWNLSR